jgi:MFS family permease
MSTEAIGEAGPVSTDAVGRWGDLFSDGRGRVVTALAAGVFFYAVNVYLATTILPSLVADIGGLSLYAWTTTLFVVTSLIGSTCAAAALRRFGARDAYRAGAAALVVGTVICAIAPSMTVFLVGRAIQGLGGGLMYALSFAMIRETLPAPLWPRASGLLSAMFGIATIVGPAIGGLTAQFGLWRVAFWVLVPLVLFFATVGSSRLPRGSAAAANATFPAVSITLLGLGVLVIAGASISSSPVVNIVGIVVAVAVFVAWLWHERAKGGLLLPGATFTGRSRLRGLYATMALLVVASTVEVYVPYFGQHLQGLDALLAGYLGAAMAAGWSAGSMSLNGVQRRRGLVLRTGPLACVAGLVLLALTGAAHSSSAGTLAGVVAGLALLGWGVGMAWPHLMNAVLTNASERDEEIAGSSISTIQLVATASGSALAGLITNLAGLNSGGVPGTEHAARALFLIFLIAPVLALGMAFRRSRPQHAGSQAGS